eukprot:GGOE01003319.1.p1 GENE.GGOE01003319.1~~GGOE01003319.1.p1  ORF type:complete len:211 (+),score=30.19 GGOE01003319.1:51-683(+)
MRFGLGDSSWTPFAIFDQRSMSWVEPAATQYLLQNNVTHFAVVGGTAVRFYGFPRQTNNIDIVVHRLQWKALQALVTRDCLVRLNSSAQVGTFCTIGNHQVSLDFLPAHLYGWEPNAASLSHLPIASLVGMALLKIAALQGRSNGKDAVDLLELMRLHPDPMLTLAFAHSLPLYARKMFRKLRHWMLNRKSRNSFSEEDAEGMLADLGLL